MRRTLPTFVEHAICLALLCLCPAIGLYPAVFQDTIPGPADALLAFRPWEEARPEGLQTSDTAESNCVAQQFYPWYAFLRDAAKTGNSILWNPLEGCGAPFLAVWRTRCLSPFSVPFYVLPLGTAAAVSALLKLIAAGLCAFYTARRLGFAPPMALALGVAFELCTPLMLRPIWPSCDVLPWFPLLFLAMERLAVGQRDSWPRAAVVIGLMALGGDPETLAAALLFCVGCLALRAIATRSPRAGAASLSGLATGTALGLALAGIQIMPYVEFLREAETTGRPPWSGPLSLRDLPGLFLPEDAARFLWVGVAPLFLIGLWCSLRSFAPSLRRRRVECLFATALVMTAVAFGLRHDAWLSPKHLTSFNAFVLAYVGVAAVDEWVVLNAPQCQAVLVRLLAIVPLTLAAMGGVFFLCWARLEDPIVTLGTSSVAVVALLVLLGATILKPSARLMGYGVSVILALASFPACGPDIPHADRAYLFPETAVVRSLQSADARISGSDALRAWPLSANGVAQIYSPGGVCLARMSAFLDRTREAPLLLRRAGAPHLLLTKEDIRGRFAPIRPKLVIEQVFAHGAALFLDRDAYPRTRIAYDARTSESFDAATLNPTDPPTVEGAVPTENARDGEGRIAVVDPERHTRIDLDVETNRPGILILADAYYPGWTATVDGRPTEISPVDGAFRAVPVPEGRCRVAFAYEPASFRIGAAISSAAAAVLVAAFAWGLAARLRKTKKRGT